MDWSWTRAVGDAKRRGRSSGARRRASWLVAGAALILVAQSARAQTCPCARRDLATVVKQADVIFVGKPLAATTDATNQTRSQPAVDVQARLMFDVATVLKGTTTRATSVVTPAGGCGFAFVVGGEYLVVGRKVEGGVFTDACQGNASGSAIASRVASIRALLQPAKPSP